MGFCLLLQIWVKYGKNISKNLIRIQLETFDHAKQSATKSLKIGSKRLIQKITEATGDLIGNKITDRITKVSKNSPKNISETVENETKNAGFDKRNRPKER